MCPSDTWMEEGKSERQRQMGQNTLLGFAHGQAGSPDPSLTHGVQQEGELAGGGGGPTPYTQESEGLLSLRSS